MACNPAALACDESCHVFAHKLAAWQQHGMNVAPSATPSRTANRPFVPPATPNNSYERGVPRDHRGMPYLDAKGGVMGQKEYNASRRQLDEGYRANHREGSQ